MRTEWQEDELAALADLPPALVRQLNSMHFGTEDAGPALGPTLEEYQGSVARQERRDRERFLGIDSHDWEARYDARTGARMMPRTTLTTFDDFATSEEMVEAFMRGLQALP